MTTTKRIIVTADTSADWQQIARAMITRLDFDFEARVAGDKASSRIGFVAASEATRQGVQWVTEDGTEIDVQSFVATYAEVQRGNLKV